MDLPKYREQNNMEKKKQDLRVGSATGWKTGAKTEKKEISREQKRKRKKQVRDKDGKESHSLKKIRKRKT